MPDNFYTRIIQPDARFHSPNRCNDTMLLWGPFKSRVDGIISDAAEQGIKLMIFETYRSQERQSLLFSQCATKLKKVGVHHFGLACDLVKDIDGEPSWKGDFTFLGKLAKHYGLTWGGSWKTFKDLVHVQAVTLQEQPELFAGTWYPEE